MTVSYAQNFEDVILFRALKDVQNGFYVDIGAQDPVVDLVSLAFYEKGWRGIHVEPNNFYASKIREARPDETVIEAAIAVKGGVIPFFQIADTGLSTADAAIAKQHEAAGFSVQRLDMPCIPLSGLLDSCAGREIHWLKIDIEGLEKQAIESWSPSPVRPWIIVVESTRPSSQKASHEEWDGMLVDLGYEFVYFDGLNRFYLSLGHLELKKFFGPGPNLFDGFSIAGSTPAGAALGAVINQALRNQSTLENELSARLAEIAEAQNAVATGDAEIERLETEASARVNEKAIEIERLQAQVSALSADATRANDEVSLRDAEILQLHQKLDKLQRSWPRKMIYLPRQIGRVLRWPFARLAFHKNGKPRGWVRKIMFHRGGRVRGVFRRWVYHSDGRPRRPFERWLTEKVSENETSSVISPQACPPLDVPLTAADDLSEGARFVYLRLKLAQKARARA